MYLRELRIQNFRPIKQVALLFREGVNVLIGENNTGKTAVLDALRICFGYGAERRDLYVTENDFHVDPRGGRSNTIQFDLAFAGLKQEEPGVFHALLAPGQGGEPEAQFHVRFTYEAVGGRVKPEYWGGEKEGQAVPWEVLERLYFIHLDALRDARRDLSPSRANVLSKLFVKLVSDEGERREYAKDVHDKIRSLERWRSLLESAKRKVDGHLSKLAVRSAPQEILIDFVEAEFRRIVEGLKIHVPMRDWGRADGTEGGAAHESPGAFEVWQNGLGYNNLIYAATVFGDLDERIHREPHSYVCLLIEEPEAHLHPQLQNRFFRYLEDIGNKGIQVFVTSHSPTITAKTDPRSLFVLGRDADDIRAAPLRDLPLERRNWAYLRRFLDVTKSQLFFARGVILVEGISEALLLPAFARLLRPEYDLEENAVEVVSVGGTAFEPFACIFNSNDAGKRLNVRCAIVTDDDRSRGAATGQAEISSRAEKALGLQGGLLRTFLAENTLEYELYLSNEILVREAYHELHPKARIDFDGHVAAKAKQFADKMKRDGDKAQFAQLVAEKIKQDESFAHFAVPDYMKKAVEWAVYADGNGID